MSVQKKCRSRGLCCVERGSSDVYDAKARKTFSVGAMAGNHLGGMVQIRWEPRVLSTCKRMSGAGDEARSSVIVEESGLLLMHTPCQQ